MIQQLVIVIVFISAVAYLLRQVYRSFQAKSACASGCGKCGVDFTKIEKELHQKGA